MITSDTLARLRWHAGFVERDVQGAKSIAECTYPPNGGADLGMAVADCLDALTSVNHELNGAVPSESATRDEAVSRDVAYAVSEITSMLREAASSSSDSTASQVFARAAWQVDMAWNLILSGDIDDLLGDLGHEERARDSMSFLSARCGVRAAKSLERVGVLTAPKNGLLLAFLGRLDLESRNWTCVDHWDADLCAIGIAHRTDLRRLVYVSNYRQPAGWYAYDCEVPNGDQPTDYATIRSSESVDERELMAVLEAHLDGHRPRAESNMSDVRENS